MKDLGTITIKVYVDEINHYSFFIREDNDDLSCIRYVVEDTLKFY